MIISNFITLFLVFLVLKLAGLITWSWLFITLPLWVLPLWFIARIIARITFFNFNRENHSSFFNPNATFTALFFGIGSKNFKERFRKRQRKFWDEYTQKKKDHSDN